MITDEEARYWWDRVLGSVAKKRFLDTFDNLYEREKHDILRGTKYDEFGPNMKQSWKEWIMKRPIKENGGIMLHGKRHKDGGIKMKGKDGRDYELEDREQILTRRVADIKDKIVCEGTGEGIGSALNELGGGVKWSNEGKCKIIKSMAKDRHKYYVKSFKTQEDYDNENGILAVQSFDLNYEDAELIQQNELEENAVAVIYATKDDREVSVDFNLDKLEKGGSMEVGGGSINGFFSNNGKTFINVAVGKSSPNRIGEVIKIEEIGGVKWATVKFRDFEERIRFENDSMATGGRLSPSKAKKILHEGKAKGKPLTEQQRKFFGARASGYPMKKENGGVLKSYPTERVPVEKKSIEQTEIKLFIDNDGDLHRQRVVPIRKNLITKIAQGKFDINLAPKLMMYLVKAGEEKYVKEHASPGDKILTKQDRENLSKIYVNEFLDEAQYGNYDNYLPKKYNPKGEKGMKIKNHLRKGRKIEDKLLEEQALKDAEGGYMENGGYAGKTPEQVWDKWSQVQRIHFIIDHTRKQHTPATQEELSKKTYRFLPEHIKQELKGHMMMGQYENGGKIQEYGNYFRIAPNAVKGFNILQSLEMRDFDNLKIISHNDLLIFGRDESLRAFLDKYSIPYDEFESYEELKEWLIDQLPAKAQNKINKLNEV